MLRKLPGLDYLLIAFAGGVIVLLLMPTCVPKQTINVRDREGNFRLFAMSIDDPKLKELRRKFSPAKRYLPPADLAKAKWNQTLTEYYAKKSPQDSQVVQVNFSDLENDTSPAKQAEADPATKSYWSNANDASKDSIVAAEKRLAISQTRAEPPRVTFGEQLEGRRGLREAVAGALVGMTLAMCFWIWKMFSPSIQYSLVDDTRVALKLSVTHGDEVDTAEHQSAERVVNLERDWISLQQPMSVLLRNFSYASIVVLSIAVVALKGFQVPL